jgi:hypothetical protein
MPYSDRDKRLAAKREAERRRRARKRGTERHPRVGPLLPPGFRLQKASDVLALLEIHVKELHTDPDLTASERARSVGFLASIALRSIEAGNVEGRLEAIESVLSQRDDAA